MSIKEYIAKNKESLIQSTREIIKIKSTQEKAKPGMPFGKGPANALRYALNLSEKMGFRTKNLDNYVGWAEWGQGEEMIGIMVHLDVVPEGSGWTYPPYEGEIHDNKIYGRGAVDDKGPAMAALYALKTLKDANVHFNRRVRVIFGTNEENGSECMKYYLKHDEAPTMAFSPDANYPIINCEKGIMVLNLETTFDVRDLKETKISYLKGGLRHNMVPEYAEVKLEGKDSDIIKIIKKLKNDTSYKAEYERTEDRYTIKSYGVSAHGSKPVEGQNAIMQLISLLHKIQLCEPQKQFIDFLHEKIGLDTTGKHLGINFSDYISGDLTLNAGVVEIDEEKGILTFDIRYPIETTSEAILQNIRENTPKNIKVNVISNKEPHYVSEDNIMIIKLKKAYEKVTGKTAYCFAIGGGTYARLFENAVAFGPVFPDQPELAHQKDEYIKVDDLLKNMQIYTYVLLELVK